QLLERDPGSLRRTDEDIANRIRVPTILELESDDEIEPLFSFIYLRDSLATDGRLHHAVDVAHPESIARARLTIDLDHEIRLAEQMEHAQVFHSGHLLPHLLDLGRLRF